jgi:hypothetical protein
MGLPTSRENQEGIPLEGGNEKGFSFQNEGRREREGILVPARCFRFIAPDSLAVFDRRR